MLHFPPLINSSIIKKALSRHEYSFIRKGQCLTKDTYTSSLSALSKLFSSVELKINTVNSLVSKKLQVEVVS